MNDNFEIHKILNQIKRMGKNFDFKRKALDEFNQHSGSTSDICTIQGIYHEANQYVTILGAEGSMIRTKKQPMILTILNDDSNKIKMLDLVNFNGKDYRVNGVVNIQELNKILDISIEEIQE